jgi:hypothetical protein
MKLYDINNVFSENILQKFSENIAAVSYSCGNSSGVSGRPGRSGGASEIIEHKKTHTFV